VDSGVIDGPRDQRAPLCARVAALCGAIRFAEPHLDDQLASLVRALRQPLRVAFAGRVSMGKSTLVNALLQAAIAPMGDRETTKVVTRFEAGEFERVELALREGATRQAFLTPAGILPPAYPVPSEHIREVRVLLPWAPVLNRITLIDTPGLESLNQATSDRTSESLFSRDSRTAIAGADALVYLMSTGTVDDAAAVAGFNELTAPDLCALNTVGVLNCRTRNPLPDQERLARGLKQAPAFRHRMIDVIPVACLLALAIGGAMLDEKGAASLRALAGYEPDDLLIDTEGYLETRCDVDREERLRLLDMLGMSGLHIALGTIRSAPGQAADLNAALLEKSGLPRLLRVINGTFANCADQIKAGQTLAAVTRLSYQAEHASGHRARVMIEELRADPAMHGIQELWALQQCARPDLDVPDWVTTGLTRLAAEAAVPAKLGLPEGAGAAEILEAARDGAARAHSYEVSPGTTRAEARVAAIARRSYTNIYRELFTLRQG
jgi:hypothetical protein